MCMWPPVGVILGEYFQSSLMETCAPVGPNNEVFNMGLKLCFRSFNASHPVTAPTTDFANHE